MFYLPHWLWKTFEGGRLQKITSGLRGRTLDVETRKSQLGILVKYVKVPFIYYVSISTAKNLI